MLELNTEPELTWLTNASIVELGLPEFLAGQQGERISEKCTLSVVLLLLLFV